IRSDSGVAHRLSLSARVVSAGDSQVKAKRQGEKRLWRLQNRRARRFQSVPESRVCGWNATNLARLRNTLFRSLYADGGIPESLYYPGNIRRSWAYRGDARPSFLGG